jgi:hypothetical protein
MAFDQPTRNRLQKFVSDGRSLLTEEFTRQLQNNYGLDPVSGDVTALENLAHLDDMRRETARILRVTLAHYQASSPDAAVKDLLERIVREQAFTVLNRLAALRMAEARELLIESVAAGYSSKGFQLYARLAGTGLGETGDAYRCYLFSVFDELALDLAVLFDRFSPMGRLFPRESALLDLLKLLNDPDLADLWAEDETIGWIYQYFNSKEERKQMRDASAAPRNSRELAVRNQFFTPRYVVEFLVDNTLGRLWYEMTQGQTALKESCRYLVRRPVEIFLSLEYSGAFGRMNPGIAKALAGDFSALPDDPDWDDLQGLALSINGYDLSETLGLGDFGELANTLAETYQSTGKWEGTSIELWICLFFEQRRWRHYGYSPEDDEGAWSGILALYAALKAQLQNADADLSQEELLKQPVYIPFRPLKDPRDIRMLDPACGSMHFGLYAFDLYEVIYREAWEKQLIPAEDFGYRPEPIIRPETVHPDRSKPPHSNYSHQPVAFESAEIVIAAEPDDGDGVLADKLYLIDSSTKFRVPYRFKAKLSEFDYQNALQTGVFTPEAGETLIRETAAWSFEAWPAVSREAAYVEFQRQIPRLIIEHNIHGVDIDPRAAQIAGLSLWLRAQKSWHSQGLKPQDRPRIARANVVCAEPMPGEESLLEEFISSYLSDTPEERLVGQLVERVFAAMKLAGEAGSLLPIEREISDDIQKAKQQWLSRPEQLKLIDLEAGQPKQQSLALAVGDITDDRFWLQVEDAIYAALERYAATAEGAGRFQRRLFAEDAARGFAFIDLCRKRYSVMLMNPPFGAGSLQTKSMLAVAYPRTKNDVYAAFVERGLQLLETSGHLGAITSRTGFFLSSFQKWREEILLKEAQPTVFADLGYGVLDAAMVETAAYCLSKVA